MQTAHHSAAGVGRQGLREGEGWASGSLPWSLQSVHIPNSRGVEMQERKRGAGGDSGWGLGGLGYEGLSFSPNTKRN